MMRTLLILIACYVGESLSQSEWTPSVTEQYFKDKFLNDSSTATVLKEVQPQVTDPDSNLKLVTVTLDYKHIYITNVDEGNGFISISAWESSSWVDSRLSWDETEYPGLKLINISPNYIWLPDITFYDSSSSRGIVPRESDVRIIVDSTGHVTYVSKQHFNFHCSMDFTNFPDDTQSCQMELTSWLDQSQEFHLMVDRADHLVTHPYSDWRIVSSSLENRTMFSFSPFGLYENVVLNLKLERRPEFFYYMYVFPGIVMAFVLPIIHLFPPGSSQKTTIAGLFFISFMLLYQSLCQQLKGFEGTRTPKIVNHYNGQLVMMVISIAISAYTSCLASAVHTSRRVPSPVRKVMDSVVGKICCFRAADVKGSFTQLGQTSGRIRFDAQNDMAPIVNHTTDEDEHSQPDNSALYFILNELRYVRERRQLEMEWYQLAVLVDRLTSIIFIIYTLVVLFE